MEPKIKKDIPTIFPVGFGISQVEGESGVVILEFLDRTSNRRDQLAVIGSFALTREKASELVNALTQQL